MNHSGAARELSERDQQRFHELYHRYYQRIYSICLRMTKNVAESEDLTQDIFIHLFRKIETFRGESAFTTWLHRVTVNHVLMYLRKRQSRAERTTESGELPVYIATGSRDPRRMRVMDRILLSEVFAKLPEGYRQAVILYDVEGLDHSEIAQKKNRSIGTSKSQLHKARAMLRELIAGRQGRVNRAALPRF
jgi:RNA polymerase sigma-70 factor (ECF subfamily)